MNNLKLYFLIVVLLLTGCQSFLAFYSGIKPNKFKTFSINETSKNLVKVTKPHKWNNKPSLVMIDTVFLTQEKLAMVDSGDLLFDMFGLISVFVFDKENELNSIVNGCNIPAKLKVNGFKMDFKNSIFPLLLDAVILKDSVMNLDFTYYYGEKKNNSILDSLEFRCFQKYFVPLGDTVIEKNDSNIAKPIIMINALKALDRHTEKLINHLKNLLDDPNSEYYNKFDVYIVSYDNIFSHDNDVEIVF